MTLKNQLRLKKHKKTKHNTPQTVLSTDQLLTPLASTLIFLPSSDHARILMMSKRPDKHMSIFISEDNQEKMFLAYQKQINPCNIRGKNGG